MTYIAEEDLPAGGERFPAKLLNQGSDVSSIRKYANLHSVL